MELHFEVHVLYANEARYLDGDRFGDWLDLFTEDLVYWAPTRTNRLRRQQRLSVSAPGGAAFFDETKDSLAWRVRRFESGMAWAEDPPSRTRHLITNLLVRPAEEDEAVEQGVSEETAREHAHYVAETGFLVYRNRLEHEVDLYSGGRTDLLRREADGSLRVARRTILLEQNVLLAKNISTFF
ncbi:3-phenylpropionate/cinnamic acid dioxygenase subunit beta [Nocardiopsis sp. HNM0947]|uniref:3-phenylpropionate/cinnamic acid dioxygenase subunit beta n=2 Tax=Nocardiopsis coralli TaxID=2772213 RepID=A0ABR9P111_9ACTN|nr:3-phenylpropionate/cinnamic acid dioxygenase subunit beta [Nocardiopsis coralli]